ncbi:MAG: VCBS repeat-containing protein [Bacteroidetes bacterium]|nr:VCBS repeat-containing protein [Bacteroidota bacterium]
MKIPIFSLLLFCFLSCSISEKDSFETTNLSEDTPYFTLLNPSETGIHFNNKLEDEAEVNYMTHDGTYQGAGVGVGDINNDGLPDIYFSGNKVPDKLYLNKGNMQFEDITESAGLGEKRGWSTGVTFADVNNDGWMDIYVCKFLLDNAKLLTNQLFINNGDKTFTEQAKKYGIDDKGYSITANFFDYNKDGFLDLYVANQPPNSREYKNYFKQTKKREFKYTDRLYRNNGNGFFTDVTELAKIKNYCFSLGATVGDFNKDGWPDIYVASDYEEPDLFYQNNGDGTFTNIANSALRHMSNFSMGCDVGDINNDGWLDIITVDMVANDNFRLKTNMSGMNPEKFWGLAKGGYHYQYMFNALQLNNGNGTFSEIAQLSGISNTDWSWSTLFADFNNDGFKDVVITNGLLKDIRNNDFIIRRNKFVEQKKAEAIAQGKTPSIDLMDLLDLVPSKKISNFLYQNNGDLSFSDRTTKWGFDEKGFSHGAAYADLDNDGDLDLVLNNMNSPASIYKNVCSDNKANNYLRLRLIGEKNNKNSLGAKAEISIGNQMQLLEVSPVRGYMSTSENILHFGVGDAKIIDRLKVTWLDGRTLEMENVEPNQVLELYQKKGTAGSPSSNPQLKLFTQAKHQTPTFRHQENEFDDFKNEILLPYRMSHQGPCLVTADVNADGLDDFYIGGASGQAGVLHIQRGNGTFESQNNSPWNADAANEDTGALFFDADGDQDLDLYVVSGGNEFSLGSANLLDRLYLNDGKGQFSKSNALPNIAASNAVASAADFDKDGDLDLFIGGRQVPGKYGSIPQSFLLQNNNGKFKEISQNTAPELSKIGMVTDAVWSDFDNDNDEDLIIVGEWIPVTIFENQDGQLTKYETASLDNTEGWWNRITLADMDKDGDMDFIIGNLGLNIKYKATPERPFKLYAKDFDQSGTNDVYLGYYDSDGICYPVRGRQCSSQEMPFIKEEFKNYAEFASASIDDILGEKKEGANYHEAKIFESTYFENLGDRNFKIHKLPMEAQIAPVFGIIPQDWNNDGHLDLLIAGNYYEREVETTRSDAGTGQVLLGDGSGNFEVMRPFESGLTAIYDVRAIQMIKDKSGTPLILVANNNLRMQVFQLNKAFQEAM